MQSDVAVTLTQTAVQVVQKLTLTEMMALMLMVTMTVHLAMIWKAWHRQLLRK
ncbi:hypothetical protein [Hyalangium gracile]|uniref:hypothetical protein n=1 Tax=Hyalangium gracile TaxID=394092 RepID=UPI001CCCE0A3|nr:hypothetical protein [Hyalangium gracile]